MKKKKRRIDVSDHTRNDVSRLVIVNTELPFVGVDALLVPIRLSMVNDVLDRGW